MAEIDIDILSSLFDAQLSSFFDSKLDNQTKNLLETIGDEISDEVAKYIDPMLRKIDKLTRRLQTIEECSFTIFLICVQFYDKPNYVT